AGVDRESFVDEKVPDFLAAFPRVKSFVLSVADAPELGVRLGRLGARAFSDDRKHPFTLVNLLPQHAAQIAGLGAEYVLPDRLITEKAEGVGGELPAAAQLAAHRGNENERKRSHGISELEFFHKGGRQRAYWLAMQLPA